MKMGTGLHGLIVVSLLAVAAVSCQRAGVEVPTSPAPPEDPVTEPWVPDVREGRERLDAGRIPLVRGDLEAPDPILHSRVARDPAIRERTRFWTEFWTSRGAEHFHRYLARMARYEELVDRELELRGFPRSLRYLPIVESGYLPGAVSRRGATGLWQIMGPTARSLDLTVSAIVDDRRDPVASTRAALDYLEELHARFGSWSLALAAYNAGPGRVGGVLARYAPDGELSGDERFLLARAHLPAETRDFVPKLLAAAYLAGSPELNAASSSSPLPPLAYKEVLVPDATSLDVVAEAAGVTEREIRELNPHYLRGFTPMGEVRVVRVPPGSGEDFERRYAQIPPESRLSFLEHVVVSGETFTHIARRYSVPVAELMDANPQVDPRRLQIGMRVVVPVGRGAG